MKHITKADIEQVLPKIDKERFNKTKSYTSKKGDHCLVGEILTQLDCSLPLNGTLFNTYSFKQLAQQSGRYDWKMDQDAVEFLAAAQYYADIDIQWGDCLRIAEEENEKA